MSAVRRAIVVESKAVTARSRPALPIAAARAGSARSALTRSAIACEKAAGSRGSMASRG
jgi:hypothetical protein